MGYTNIGRLAQLLGLSANTIRKYERKGLLQTDRNPDNNYREIDHFTVGMLIRMRELKQTGYSFEDVEHMVTPDSLDEVREYLHKREAELEEEIKARRELIDIIKRWDRDINAADEGIKLGIMPAVRCMKFKDLNGMIEDKADIVALQAWLKRIPATFPGNLYSREEILNELKDCKGDTCMFCYESFYQAEEPLHSEKALLLCEVPCLIYTECMIDNRKTSQAIRMIREQGYTPGQYAFSEILATTRICSQYPYEAWVRFYIPIEDVNTTKN